MRVVVVGAGVGGLVSAIALRRAGHEVQLLEASEHTGGQVARVSFDGVAFDEGPHMVLDQPGLAWVFESLGTRLEDHLELIRLEHPWRVSWHDGNKMDVFADLDRTAEGFESHARGAAKHYKAFVARMTSMHEQLVPLQRRSPLSTWQMLTGGHFSVMSFLRKPLEVQLQTAGLPLRVLEALGVFTRISGQRFATAPAALAVVPALVHQHGAYMVKGGMARIPEVLTELAIAAGVEVRTGVRVQKIQAPGGRVKGVVVDDALIEADVVVGGAAALSVLLELLEPAVPAHAKAWGDVSLQSPGVTAYATATYGDLPYLELRLGTKDTSTRLLPGVVDETQAGKVKLVQPLRHGVSDERVNDAMTRMIDASWWKDELGDMTVRGTRTPAEHTVAANLYAGSTQPVITQAFVRNGRLPHKVAEVHGLYLAGGATPPGDWVSAAAMSGVLAAGEVG
jgi:phytoene dehydrogenase-like protein